MLFERIQEVEQMLIISPIREIDFTCKFWSQCIYGSILHTIVSSAVYHGRRNILVPKEVSYIYYVDPGSKHVHSFAVTKLMAMHVIRERLILSMEFASIFVNYVLDTISAHCLASTINNQRLSEQGIPALSDHILLYKLCGLVSYDNDTVFIAFAMQLHSWIITCVYVTDLYVAQLLHSTATVVQQCHRSPVAKACTHVDVRLIDQPGHLLGRQK